MKTSELIKKLQKSLKENGDVDVMIDVEARCYSYHYVPITSSCFENIEGKNEFILYPDYVDTYFADKEEE